MSEQVERMLPLYEAKMIHHYDHRWATYERDGSVRDVTLAEKQDPDFAALPRYWVRESVVRDRLRGSWNNGWILGWRNVCRSTDERTLVCGAFPVTAVGHSLPMAGTQEAMLLQVFWSSFVVDFVSRQKVGGVNMTFGYVNQFAVPGPDSVPPWSGGTSSWFRDRGTWLQSAQSWSSAADRPRLRIELDAAMFHLYDIGRDDVDYIMDTFPIVRRKDEAAHGEYRTKRLILEVYDQMATAIADGSSYRSPLEEVGGPLHSR